MTPGVSEAVEAAATAMWLANGYDFNADPNSSTSRELMPDYLDAARVGLIAAYPVLREGLVADVLAPIEASNEDCRDVAAWLIGEADKRVQFFPQRRDGIDALMRHLAAGLSTAKEATT